MPSESHLSQIQKDKNGEDGILYCCSMLKIET